MVRSNRRSKGTGSVYPVAGGFEAAISFVAGDGKRKRRRRFSTDAETAYANLRELRESAAATAGDIDNPPSTVRDYFAAWLRSIVAPNVEAATFAGYRSAIENHILPGIGDRLFSDLDAAAAAELLAELHRAGVDGRTRQTVHSLLRQIFEHAITIGDAVGNPLERIKRPKHERRQIKPFTAGEVRAIIHFARDKKHPQFAALYTIAFSTGARLGELFALRWSDLDGGEMSIDRAVAEVDGKLIYKRPKNRASIRKIELTAEAVAELVVLKGNRPTGRDDLVFRGRRGGPLRRSSFGRLYWSPLLDRLGIPRRGFHHCRHTFATLSLTATPPVPVHVVARILGHASAARTLRTYAHYVDGSQRLAVRAMSEVLTEPDALAGR